MNNASRVIFQLIDYEVWCNERAIEFLGRLAPAELTRDFGFGHRTPHRTMFHIVDVMQGWSRCIGPAIEKPVWFSYEPSAPLEAVRRLLASAAKTFKAAAEASHAAGVLAEDRRLHQVFHIIAHGTHHRGQLLSMATLMGYDQPFEGGDFGGWSNDSTAR